MREEKRMDRAEEELERRSRYLSGLIQQQRKAKTNNNNTNKAEKEEEKKEKPAGAVAEMVVKEEKKEAAKDDVVKDRQRQQNLKQKTADGDGGDPEEQQLHNVRVRAADMPPALQRRAFRCAREALAAMPKLDSKRLALTLKKEFDSSYGPAWHCIVGKSFGSYVTHSLGGFLYFSIDKVYILIFRTVVEPLDQ